MNINRRLFLQNAILSLPAAKLLSSVGGAFGAPPINKKFGWKELELYYPQFAQEQRDLFKEYGEMLAYENIKPWWNEQCSCVSKTSTWVEKGCARHDNYYYCCFGKSDDNDHTRKFNFDNVKTPWPANLDLSDGTAVMDAYARVVHNVDGLEEWFIKNTTWTIFSKPIMFPIEEANKVVAISGVHSWNEPGEPGGCNAGPYFHFLIDGKWQHENTTYTANLRNAQTLSDAIYDNDYL